MMLQTTTRPCFMTPSEGDYLQPLERPLNLLHLLLTSDKSLVNDEEQADLS